MRVNVYAEEMTERVEIISKEIDGQTFTGLRLYLELPCTIPGPGEDGKVNVRGPFMHRPGDDDSAAVTFWGKRDLRGVLRKMLAMLDEHYGARGDGDGREEHRLVVERDDAALRDARAQLAASERERDAMRGVVEAARHFFLCYDEGGADSVQLALDGMRAALSPPPQEPPREGETEGDRG